MSRSLLPLHAVTDPEHFATPGLAAVRIRVEDESGSVLSIIDEMKLEAGSDTVRAAVQQAMRQLGASCDGIRRIELQLRDDTSRLPVRALAPLSLQGLNYSSWIIVIRGSERPPARQRVVTTSGPQAERDADRGYLQLLRRDSRRRQAPHELRLMMEQRRLMRRVAEAADEADEAMTGGRYRLPAV